MSKLDPEKFAEMVHRMTGENRAVRGRLRGGGVIRYHNEPDIPIQTVGEHTWRLITILLYIWPDCSLELLKTAQSHDNSEGLHGDPPAPVKWAYPEIREIYAEMGDQYMEESLLLEKYALTDSEIGRLKCADYLELADYCSKFKTPGAHRVCSTGLAAVGAFAKRLNVEDSRALLQYLDQAMELRDILEESGPRRMMAELREQCNNVG